MSDESDFYWGASAYDDGSPEYYAAELYDSGGIEREGAGDPDTYEHYSLGFETEADAIAYGQGVITGEVDAFIGEVWTDISIRYDEDTDTWYVDVEYDRSMYEPG